MSRGTSAIELASTPTSPSTPALAKSRGQVADPDVIASTGTGSVSLNFILKPWSGPADDTLHDGRTWAEAYGQMTFRVPGKGAQDLRPHWGRGGARGTSQ